MGTIGTTDAMDTEVAPADETALRSGGPGDRLVLRHACPWCGSKGSRLLCEYPYREEPLFTRFRHLLGDVAQSASFAICECPCGVLYQREVLNPEAHLAMYDAWEHSETSLDFTLFYLQELLMVRARLRRPAKEITVLDYGMGWGKFCEVARTLDFETLGFEVNAEKRAFAASRGISVVEDLGDIPEGTIDFINVEQVLEHVPSPRDVVRELTGLLKPGGLLKISVPHRSRSLKRRLKAFRDTPESHLYGYFMEIWPLAHINSFTRRSMETVLRPTLLHERVPLTSLILTRPSWDGVRLPLNVAARPVYKSCHPRSNYLFFIKLA